MLSLLLLACAPYETGVLSVHIALEGAEGGSGSVEVDVPGDIGLIDAFGLPEPGEGELYVPVLSWAEGPRSGLPEASGGHVDQEALEQTEMEPLRDVGDAAWSIAFTSVDSPTGLGALRGCAILLAVEGGEAMEGVQVLSGQVDFEAEPSSGEEEQGGHSHGV